MRIADVDPERVRLSPTRSDLARSCEEPEELRPADRDLSSSPTSSRNTVPPCCATSKSPLRLVSAPVKAPFCGGRRARSRARFSGRAPQLTGMKAWPLPAARSCRGAFAGDQLLAGAGLSLDEHRRVGGGDRPHLLEHRLQRGAPTDHLVDAAIGQRPRSGAGSRRLAGDGALDRVEQIVGLEGLGEELVRPRLDGLDRHGDVTVAGDEDDGDLHVAPRQLLLQLDPAEAREVHVEDQAGRRLARGPLEEGRRRRVRLDPHPGRSQQRFPAVAGGFVVVDDADQQLLIHGSLPRMYGVTFDTMLRLRAGLHDTLV